MRARLQQDAVGIGSSFAVMFFFFSSRRRHTRCSRDWSSDVCSSDLCFYLSAWEEDKYVIAQANVALDEKQRITTELVNCRQAGNFVLKNRDEVDYVDVSPKQLVSVAASLIPFLENDDANRALMGSNMQRRGAPPPQGEGPTVGSGRGRATPRDSGPGA